MRRSTSLALAAIVLAAVAIRLSPLLSALYWGSDYGEYFGILRTLVATGAMPSHYLGWGSTYPFFPGMFFVQDGVVRLGAVDLPTVLNLVVPVLGALAVVPIFLVGIEVTGDRRVALFAAAFLAGAMPHAYPTSHAAPATLGDLLAFATLLLFLRIGKDGRMAIPLGLTTLALVATHHLGAYFLILMVLATIILRGLVRPLEWTASLKREVAYAGFLLAVTFAYWLGYATAFRENILTDVNIQPWWLLLAAFPILLAAVAGVLALRRRIAWRFRPHYPDFHRSSTMYGFALAFVLGLMGLTVLDAIPGTGIALPASTFAYFAPFLVLVAFSAAGRKFFDFLRAGIGPSAWFLALSASAILGTVVATRVLIPYRHVEYLVVPVALLAGTGFVRLLDLSGAVRGRRGAVVALCGALLIGNFAMAIPPPNFVANWNEGTMPRSLDGAYWARDHMSGLTLADHRVSTTLFGFAGVNATWDTTTTPFFAPDFAQAMGGLVNVAAPSGRGNVSYVWVDADEIAGVQLRPWEPAVPMPAATVAMLSNYPFVKVFDTGYSQVYWIAWGCDPSC